MTIANTTIPATGANRGGAATALERPNGAFVRYETPTP